MGYSSLGRPVTSCWPPSNRRLPEDRWQQRIFIIWERTAIPFVFTKVPLSPRKPETVRKSTPEPLSAVLINTELEGGGGRVGECTLLYFISLLCTLYSRLGQIIRNKGHLQERCISFSFFLYFFGFSFISFLFLLFFILSFVYSFFRNFILPNFSFFCSFFQSLPLRSFFFS